MSQTDLIFKNISSFTEGIAILLFVSIMLGKKDFFWKSKLKSFIFVVFYMIFTYFAVTYLSPGFHTICILIFEVCLCVFLLNSNFYATLIFSVIFVILIALSEMIAVYFGTIFFGIGMHEFAKVPPYNFIGMILSKIIVFAVIIYLYKKELEIFRNKIFKRENSHIVFVVFQMFIVNVLFLGMNASLTNSKTLAMFYTLYSLVFILLVVLSVIDFKEREKLLKFRVNYGIQEKYIKDMEAGLNIIRQEKHEFKNHLNTMLAMCTMNKSDTVEKLKLYIKNIDESLNSSIQFYKSGNDYIDGLLAVKSNRALKNDIHLDIDFDVSLEGLNIDSGDLISIFGNIIDNAFDALKKVDAGKRIFSLTTFKEEDSFYISFSNTGPVISEAEIKKIFNTGYTSKKNDSNNHGFGLPIVKQIVEQNKGYVSVCSTEDETEFLVRFPI
jgi:two-component system, LytTR family, sensor histidine kinase AgrC